jgi:hypothetical protein
MCSNEGEHFALGLRAAYFLAATRRASILGGDVYHLTYGPIMHQLHTDDAIDYLARHLGNKFNLATGSITASIQCAPRYDVEVQYVAVAFWQERGTSILNQTSAESGNGQG